MDKAKLLANKLTPVQREAVLDGYIGDQGIVTVRSLMKKGLYRFESDTPNGRYGFMKLTDLGNAVRAALRAHASAMEGEG